MFGLFYILTNLIGTTVSGIKTSIENGHYKEQGWKDYNNGTDYGKHTYYDAEGKERDLTTNHIMFTYRKNGDLYIEDTQTFKIRNLSEEKRNEKIKILRETHPYTIATFYKYWDCVNSELRDESNVGIPGNVYKDINNGQLYFERHITWRKNDLSKAGIQGDYCSAYFYLKISDGKIVSVTDEQIKKDKEDNREANYDEFINFFNSEQEKGGFVLRNRNRYANSKSDYYLANEKIYNNL